jgi:hypothetical protein
MNPTMLLAALVAVSLSAPATAAPKAPPKPFSTVASVEGMTEYSLP